MALFPRFSQELSPFFRLFDEYEKQFSNNALDRTLRSFSPKFDVKETKEAYELHGEFPGIDQKDINIEWTDANTLSIHGRHEESREEGQRPQGFIEEPNKKDKQPSVEDEGKETQVAKQGNKEVTKRGDQETKFWVSERSVGEFHRSFAFPAPVDQDAVKASLKNGILSIVVPKSKAPQPRRVKIE
jgi:HSP20 family molecular chaperone IbpA